MSSTNLTRLAPRGKPQMARQRWVTQTALTDRTDPRLTWYLGLGFMAALEVIEWPVAIVVAVGHELTYRARTRALLELAKGIEAGG